MKLINYISIIFMYDDEFMKIINYIDNIIDYIYYLWKIHETNHYIDYVLSSIFMYDDNFIK
jgi:hypothetical protein